MRDDEIKRLLSKRFHCSQIMMKLGMEAKGLEDPTLLRAMNGLAGGLGGRGKNCGALTGGVAMFGLFAGRGAEPEPEDPVLMEMSGQLVDWFEDTFGSVNCDDILQGDMANIPQTCPNLICAAAQKAFEILEDHGLILDGTAGRSNEDFS